jgi:hypothetical protein
MSIRIIFTAIVWGSLAGVLSMHLLSNLLAAAFCLHGLLLTRWKRLAKKVTGQVKYGINLMLLLRVALYALLFAALLRFGDSYVKQTFWFEYRGTAAIIFGCVFSLAAALSIPAAIKRLAVIWRMSHEVDYAEKRQRTRILKS